MSRAVESEIVGLIHGTLSAEDIRKMAVAEISRADTAGPLEHNTFGTLEDPRLGSIMRNSSGCSTCDMSYIDDQGHMGFHDLIEPIYNPLFAPQKSSQGKHLMNILHMVCLNCSASLLTETDSDFYRTVVNGAFPDMKFKEIWSSFAKTKIAKECPECHITQPTKYEFTDKSDVIAIYTITASLKELVSSWIYNTVFSDVEYIADLEKQAHELLKQRISKGDRAAFVIPKNYIYNLLSRISDDTVRLMGINPDVTRPESMMFKYFPVPPPHVRPTHFRDTRSSEDDFTIGLRNIITNNVKLREKVSEFVAESRMETASELKSEATAAMVARLKMMDKDDVPFNFTYAVSPGISSLIEKIQGYVNSYISDSNSSQGMFKNSPKYAINFRMRYQPGSAANGKGRIRGTLSGKRTDNSLRSVIGGHMYTAIDEIGLPLEAAKRLTIAEIVTRFNFDRLQRHVNNGRDKYPGALYLQRPGHLVALKGAPRHRQIREGDLVYRHIVDGDIIFMNRQPSLHKLSMMGHRVRVVPGLSIRLNIGATDPYGADFDGDEMHVYVPQSPEAIQEVLDLAMVSKNFIRPSNAKPAIKLVQDGALGVYLLGEASDIPRQIVLDLLATSAHATKILGNAGDSAESLVPSKGIDVLRLLFRKNYRFTKGHKSTISDIATRTYFDVSSEEALAFMSEVQFITRDFINFFGSTIGARDMRLPEAVENEIQRTLDKIREICTNLQHEYSSRKEPDLAYLTLQVELDNKIAKTITENLSSMAATYVMPHLVSDRNGIYVATDLAESKGKFEQLAKMIICAGQQIAKSPRTPYVLNGDRTTAYYTIFDNSLESRGFIASNFSKGYTLSEAYHIARAGRDGLVDTTHKTQTTGYFNRRIGKNSESLISTDDFTIRRDDNSIVLLAFGSDGFDCQKIIRDNELFGMYTTDRKTFEERFFGSVSEENNLLVECRKRVLDSVQGIDMYDNNSFKNLDKISVFVPISIPKTIETAQIMFSGGKTISSKKAFGLVLEAIKDSIPILTAEDYLITTLGRYSGVYDYRRMVLCTLFMPYLCSREIARHQITEQQLRYILSQISRQTLSAYTQPGKNLGIESAITIGEQSTQDALDSFHSSGSEGSSSAVAKKALGVSSIFEINTLASKYEGESTFSGTGTSKTPRTKTKNKIPRSKLQYQDKRIRVFLKEPGSMVANREFVNRIRSVRLADIADTAPSWYYDPKADLEFADYSYVFEMFELENDETFTSDTLDYGDIPDSPSGWSKSISDYVLKIDLFVSEVLKKEIDVDRFFKRMNRILNDHLFIGDYGAPWTRVLIAYDEIGADKTFPCFIRIQPRKYDRSLTNLLDQARRLIMNIFVNGPNRMSRVSVEMKSGNLSYMSPTVSDEDGLKVTPIKYYAVAGVRLIDLLSDPYINDLIDLSRLDTNDYIEFYDMLGVSAAKRLMFRDAFELYGISKVLPRHITLVISNMTREGEILPLKRNGTELITPSVLARASNEQPILNLVRGAVSGSFDPTKNVSTAVITGTPFKTGSGFSVPVPVSTDIGTRKVVPQRATVRDLEKRIEAESLREIISSELAISEIQKIFIGETQFVINATASV